MTGSDPERVNLTNPAQPCKLKINIYFKIPQSPRRAKTIFMRGVFSKVRYALIRWDIRVLSVNAINKVLASKKGGSCSRVPSCIHLFMCALLYTLVCVHTYRTQLVCMCVTGKQTNTHLKHTHTHTTHVQDATRG